MIRRIAINAQPLPLTLKLTDARTYGIIAVFTMLSVLTPWGFHQFHLAGATYLPMHIFIFIAALGFGWQAGVIVGLLTPFASYLVSGMPALTVLPQIAVEVAVYGLVAGLLRHRYNLRVVWALLGAIIGGRLALLGAVIVVQFASGNVYSPLGAATTPSAAVWHTVALSWPGMLIQLALIPTIFWIASRYTLKKRSD